MTIFDYLVLFVLAASVVISTMRGLVKEILSLTGWIVAFIALFIGVRLLMALLMMAVDALIQASGLSLADRGLGGLFGLGRGIVIVLAAVILCSMTAIPRQAFWKDALLSPLAEAGARTVKPFLPAALAQHVQF